MDLNQINENLKLSFRGVKKDMLALRDAQNRLATRIKEAADEKHEELEREFESKIHNLQIDSVKSEQFDMLYRKVVELQKTIDSLEKNSSNKNDVKTDIIMLNATNSSQKKQIDELKKQNKDYEERIESLEQDRVQEKAHYTKQLKEHKKIMGEMEKEKKLLKKLRETLNIKLVDYRQLEREFMLKKEFKKKVAPVEKKVRKVDIVKSEVHSLGTKIENLRNETKDYAKRLELKKEVDDAKNKITTLKEQLSKIDKTKKTVMPKAKKTKERPKIITRVRKIFVPKREKEIVIVEPLKEVNVEEEKKALQFIKKHDKSAAKKATAKKAKNKKTKVTTRKVTTKKIVSRPLKEIDVDAEIKAVKELNKQKKTTKKIETKTPKGKVVKKTTVVEEIKPIDVGEEKQARSFLDRILRRTKTETVEEEIPLPPKKQKKR